MPKGIVYAGVLQELLLSSLLMSFTLTVALLQYVDNKEFRVQVLQLSLLSQSASCTEFCPLLFLFNCFLKDLLLRQKLLQYYICHVLLQDWHDNQIMLHT
jgi:hypothetical protein